MTQTTSVYMTDDLPDDVGMRFEIHFPPYTRDHSKCAHIHRTHAEAWHCPDLDKSPRGQAYRLTVTEDAGRTWRHAVYSPPLYKFFYRGWVVWAEDSGDAAYLFEQRDRLTYLEELVDPLYVTRVVDKVGTRRRKSGVLRLKTFDPREDMRHYYDDLKQPVRVEG